MFEMFEYQHIQTYIYRGVNTQMSTDTNRLTNRQISGQILRQTNRFKFEHKIGKQKDRITNSHRHKIYS